MCIGDAHEIVPTCVVHVHVAVGNFASEVSA